jgi:hypothetical protein
LGQHTIEVLQELGHTSSAIDGLLERGVAATTIQTAAEFDRMPCPVMES